jgi:hypothetical protein
VRRSGKATPRRLHPPERGENNPVVVVIVLDREIADRAARSFLAGGTEKSRIPQRLTEGSCPPVEAGAFGAGIPGACERFHRGRSEKDREKHKHHVRYHVLFPAIRSLHDLPGAAIISQNRPCCKAGGLRA